MRAIKGEVTGKVQGVFFRKSMKAQADMLGVSGWVRNTEAGSVEFLIVGAEAALAAMQKWLYVGPRLARVDAVDCGACQVENLAGFTIDH
jgi:acylphosphatase